LTSLPDKLFVQSRINRGEYMKKYILEAIVFTCGAVVMVLELVGSRVLAPYLGTSIIVWTSLIGVILGCLSLGYWYGGRLADRRPDYKTFSRIIFIAGILIGFVAFLKEHILTVLQNAFLDIQVGAPVATLILFGLPSILLGMVAPYAVRLKMGDVNHSGETVGNLYAVSTVGSITGTFAAGYYLIAFFGSTKILIMLSLVLVLTSLLPATEKKGRIQKAGVVLFLLAGLAAAHAYDAARERNGFFDVDTRYNRVWIYETTHPVTQKPIRALVTSPGEIQSAKLMDGSDDLALTYTKYYRLARHFNAAISESLLIGGAGYSYTNDYLKKYPDAKIDAVEIDPGMTDLARKHFDLVDNARLQIIHEDGRTFINRSAKRYDAIFCDAFTSLYTIPFQLTTKESVTTMYNLLNDNGLVLVNIISAIEGEEGMFLRAEYATYKSVFPQVWLFPVSAPGNGRLVQNIMLVALKSRKQVSFNSRNTELAGYLSHVWIYPIRSDIPVLTDDLAPVDNYIVRMIHKNK
jgi:spermidine synthase